MPAKHPTSRIDPARALAMYDDGASDTTIAKFFGINTSCVCRWRQRHGLGRTACNDNRLTSSQIRHGKNMLRNGATKAQIAAHLGVSSKAVQTLRRYMDDLGLRSTGVSGRSFRAAVLADKSLPQRIEHAIGMHVPKDIRMDAVNDMYLELIDGKLPVDQIEAAAPRFRSRAFNMAGYNYAVRSIDEGKEEGLTLAETLSDPQSMKPFEEVLERHFANDI